MGEKEMRRLHVIPAVLVPLLCVALLWAAPRTHDGVAHDADRSQSPNPAVTALNLPTAWVPFSADRRMIDPDGEKPGSWYRSGNGSYAIYSYGSEGAAITIDNTSTRLTYVQIGHGGWRSMPIRP